MPANSHIPTKGLRLGTSFSAAENLQLDELITESRNYITQALRGKKKPLLAYSGGKDSIVVAHLCSDFGIRESVCEISFYFPFQVKSAEQHAKLLNLEVTYRNSLTLEWLGQHPQFIFATDRKNRADFFHHRQQNTVARESKARGSDVVFFGRRLQENSIKAPIYDKQGITQCHPIRRWKEEHVWLYLERNRIPVPQIYYTPYGEDQGNGPWNIYTGSKDPLECWKAIFQTDPNVVREAAPYIHTARSFLNSIEQN